MHVHACIIAYVPVENTCVRHVGPGHPLAIANILKKKKHLILTQPIIYIIGQYIMSVVWVSLECIALYLHNCIGQSRD